MMGFNSFCQTGKEQLLVKKIISTYSKIQIFENEYEKSNSDEYQDSINQYNYRLFQFLSDKKFSKLNRSDLKRIVEKTQIIIKISNDNRLVLVSWHVFDFYPIPMCSNIVFFDGKVKLMSLNGTANNDFGDNIQNDTIYKITLKSKPFYILMGSNKCGNLCIQEMASMYSISNGNLVKCINSFFDGKNYLTDVQFDYLINSEMKIEPNFQIQNSQLIRPIFNEDKTKIVGSKRFTITVPGVGVR
jgi:hypothetical protein